MERNIQALAGKEYDLVIVGGGIFGVFAAWDAALRGCSVALIERDDFAHATSAHHFRMVHGGIRYLQHGDFARVRESSAERRAMMRIAPHLVEPLPVVVPAYGHGMQGKEALGAGLLLYDLVAWDRNKGLSDPDRRIPPGRILSRKDCLALFPELERPDLGGAALFYDGQVYNPSRMALSILKSAIQAGIDAANYVEATGFLLREGRAAGVRARDRLTGTSFDIRGRVVLNAAGPWAAALLARRPEMALDPTPTFSRDACFIVHRPLVNRYALSVPGQTRDPDALIHIGNRHLFIVPWQESTLVGVWHKVHQGAAEAFTLTEEELRGFIGEVNSALPSLDLTLEDVSRWMAGLVLFGESQKSQVHLSYGKRSQLIDHAREHRIDGLITMIGVRFTTARGVAEKAVDLALQKLGRKPVRSRTAQTPVNGGDFEQFEGLVREAIRQDPAELGEAAIRRLAHNYGSSLSQVFAAIAQDPALAAPLGTSRVRRAEAMIAARDEMVSKLSDVVFRRTDLGTAGHPGDAALEETAGLVGDVLGWSPGRRLAELAEVRQILEGFGAKERPEPVYGDLQAEATRLAAVPAMQETGE